jgi:hypothetical protein
MDDEVCAELMFMQVVFVSHCRRKTKLCVNFICVNFERNA